MGLKNHERGAIEQMIRQITQREWRFPTATGVISQEAWSWNGSDAGKPAAGLEKPLAKNKNRQRKGKKYGRGNRTIHLEIKERIGTAGDSAGLVAYSPRTGILPPGFNVSMQTLYRLIERHGLDEGAPPGIDRRKFEAELPMISGRLILCTGL